MPQIDGTGPNGQGAGTGRKMGSCAEGRGMDVGCCGRNRQNRRRFISPENELSALENEEKNLMEELEIIRKEKEALENKK